MWKKYRDLYAGGEQIREKACEYLVRRNKEPNDVYEERLCRVFYENYIGSIIDWYAATLLRREPVMVAEGANQVGQGVLQRVRRRLRSERDQLVRFLPATTGEHAGIRQDVHRAGFPAVRSAGAEPGGGRRDGAGRGRFWWSTRRTRSSTGATTHDGNLAWIVIRTSCLRQEKVTDTDWKRETRWIYYDREDFRIYSRRKERGEGRDRAGG